uniref:ATP-dependent DNA helicase n=1 Tax=Amphimedon queenslandica TaxID=400682 RepID=A0A1X7VGI9_AMPQE
HKKQFPLILSYAITIHKCQGLSLDTAFTDLSTDVFGDGIAYVALFRVCTLNGLHLISFDPPAI